LPYLFSDKTFKKRVSYIRSRLRSVKVASDVLKAFVETINRSMPNAKIVFREN